MCRKASELKFRPLVNVVDSARAQAETGDRTQAMLYLRQIVATGQGPRLRPVIVGATEFARYRDDAEFKAMLSAIVPCRAEPYRQFDFWVGEWEVQDPAKNVVGRNKVTLEQEGCLILENWTWYVAAPGKVRQMAAQSTDGQKTWVTTWDSYYVRKGK